MTDAKRRMQEDIAKTFDFIRFMIAHPQMLRKIKNGAEIRFVSGHSRKAPRTARSGRNVQEFSSETVFHEFRGQRV